MTPLLRGWAKAWCHKIAHYYAQSNAKSLCGRIWYCGPRTDTSEPNMRTCPQCYQMYWALRKNGY